MQDELVKIYIRDLSENPYQETEVEEGRVEETQIKREEFLEDYYEDYGGLYEAYPHFLQQEFYQSPSEIIKPFWVSNEEIVEKVEAIPDRYLHKNKDDIGFVIGKKTVNDLTRYVGTHRSSEGHLLVAGGTGSGKSSGVLKPTVANWRGTVLALDIKGEFIKYWMRRRGEKRKFKILSFDEDADNAATFDPFYYLRQDKRENLASNSTDLASDIIPIPITVKDAFWLKLARMVLAGGIIYFFDLGVGFIDAMVAILSKPIRKLIDEIYASDNGVAKLFVSQLVGITDSKMLAGIGAELSRHVIVFATSTTIDNALSPSKSEIRFEDLLDTNIFLRIPQEKLSQYGCVLSMILTQFIRSLERRPDKFDWKGRKPPPILIVLDEFPALEKLEVITTALSTLRSKGVNICLAIQSVAQLDVIYGEGVRKVILDNCAYKAILSASDRDTQKHLSDLSGSVNTTTKSLSTSHKPYLEHVEGYSWQVGDSREPVVFPHEFATLKDIIFYTPEGIFRVDKSPACK